MFLKSNYEKGVENCNISIILKNKQNTSTQIRGGIWKTLIPSTKTLYKYFE